VSTPSGRTVIVGSTLGCPRWRGFEFGSSPDIPNKWLGDNLKRFTILLGRQEVAKVQTPDGVTAAIDLSCKAFLDCDAMLERGFKSRVYDWKRQKGNLWKSSVSTLLGAP